MGCRMGVVGRQPELSWHLLLCTTECPLAVAGLGAVTGGECRQKGDLGRLGEGCCSMVLVLK